MPKPKEAELDTSVNAFVTADLVGKLFLEALEELRAIRVGHSSNWIAYEALRDEAFAGLKWCESLANKANPTGPNVGTRRETSPPKSPAETS